MSKRIETLYFDGEGRPFMEECINRSVEWCVVDGLRTVVIFTGTGDGPQYAAQNLLTQDRYKHLHIVAVTPPFGRAYKANPTEANSPVIRAGINPAMRDSLSALGINVVAAHLPFKEVQTGRGRESAWSLVAESFGVLGGGFALCVQALLVACDAGVVESGERVVVLGADTSFVAIACRTESFLSPYDGLLVEHIICRPSRYSISKRSHETMVEPLATISGPPQVAPPPSVVAQPRQMTTGARKTTRKPEKKRR
jgi:hypothetical protein